MDEHAPIDDCIKYQDLKSWKSRTTKDMVYHTGIILPSRLEITYFGKPMLAMETNGDMIVFAGYCSDRASGPTVDTPDTIYPAFGHDGGYQFMRKSLLDPKIYKDKFDRLLQKWLVQCGIRLAQMEWDQGNHMKARWIRATIRGRAAAWYTGVKLGGGSACQPGPEPTDEEKTAPGPDISVVV